MTSVGFFPCLIDHNNHAIPLKSSDPRAQQVVDYVSKISAEAGFESIAPARAALRGAMEGEDIGV